MQDEEGDESFVEGLLALLATDGVDYTLFFRRLADAASESSEAELLTLFAENQRPIRGWLEAWRRRIGSEPDMPAERAASMRRQNPAFIPRNHRVEEAIERAVNHGDFGPFETLVQVVTRPHDDQPEHAHLAEPPAPEERVTQTFCGT
jgi:uncharacterized protein YdiU (UPF0061 family)